jgi:hypothetical protein
MRLRRCAKVLAFSLPCAAPTTPSPPAAGPAPPNLVFSSELVRENSCRRRRRSTTAIALTLKLNSGTANRQTGSIIADRFLKLFPKQ